MPRTRGPVPKRSTERRRRNKDSQPAKVQVPAARPSRAPADPAAGLTEGRAREVIARVRAERSRPVLEAGAAVERRVTVQRAILARLIELEREELDAELPENTHPIARRWYRSLKESGQAALYEPSDWAAAVLVAEAMTRLLASARLSAVGFAAVWSAMGELLTTEGARRRARVELERGEESDGDEEREIVDELSEMRRRLAREG